MDLKILPVLKDNYTYLLHDGVSGETAAVDPSLAEPVLIELNRQGWRLTHIFSTHHHWDHTDGNLPLKEATGCKVMGFSGDANRIPGIDIKLVDGECFRFGESDVRVMHIPGHTLGHIAYVLASERMLFCGDTLFSLGCGRLFEGTPAQMQESLEKLSQLPGDTQVYCGHEYTEANGRFALTLEPGNQALHDRLAEVKQLRTQEKPSLPSTIAQENATNPFLRWKSREIRRNLGMGEESNVEIFAEVRRRKDHF